MVTTGEECIMKFLVSLFAVALVLSDIATAQFTQAPLPYAYNALEPFVDAQTMEIHYSKHHAAYVSNLNKALSESAPSPITDLESMMANISKFSTAVRNNGGGHYNHTLFWEILTPKKNTQPSATLVQSIEETFGGMDKMKEQLNKAAATRFGSGWAWLLVTPDKKLAISSTPNQDNPLMDVVDVRGTPILGIDVWEHAYYLKYQNRRGDYLQALWNVINWDAVSARYEKAISR
jgi:Fe-Mn family superoxide dismutase